MRPRTPVALALIVVLALAGAGAGVAIDHDAAWPAGAGAVVGALLGAVTGLRLARRPKVADADEARRLTGLPLVAHVPPPATGGRDRRAADEAFRMLRAALDLAGGTELGVGVLVAVTSAAPGEGKTTVTVGLARAIARSGRPVVAVEADLRRPALARALDVVEPGRGLTAAIVGAVAVDELLVEVEPGLRILPAGELPPNAPELLGGPDAARVLDELRGLGATVVLDTAPLLPVADSRELLALGGIARVVLVARPGEVHPGELRDAVALLPADAVGVLAVSGTADVPRSYDRYLRETGPA